MQPRSLMSTVHSRVPLPWESNAITDLAGDRAQAVMQVTGSSCKYRWNFACSPAAHLLLGHLAPIRSWTYTSPRPGVWRPLVYNHCFHFHQALLLTITCQNVPSSSTQVTLYSRKSQIQWPFLYLQLAAVPYSIWVYWAFPYFHLFFKTFYFVLGCSQLTMLW